MFSEDPRAVVVSVLNIVQFALLYLITINVIKTRRQAKYLLAMIALGVTVGAALHLAFYARGVSLWLTSDSPGQNFLQTGEIRDLFTTANATGQFYRTSHFYGSFITPCGVAIVVGMMSLWLDGASGPKYKIYWAVAIGVASTSLLVTGNRTILLSCALSVIGLLAISFAAESVNFRLRKFLSILFIMLLCMGGAHKVQRSMLDDVQWAAYFDAVFDSASDSISHRFSMWGHACDVFCREPKILLYGVGPDLAWRSPDNAKIAQIMTIPSMQFQVPSYHNFYFDLILNFGFVFALVFLGVIVGTVGRLAKTFWRTRDEVSGVCLCALLMWFISWLTVSMAWGKVLFVLAQLLAVAHLAGFRALADDNPFEKETTYTGRFRTRNCHQTL
jgi:O-antigen ligase